MTPLSGWPRKRTEIHTGKVRAKERAKNAHEPRNSYRFLLRRDGQSNGAEHFVQPPLTSMQFFNFPAFFLTDVGDDTGQLAIDGHALGIDPRPNAGVVLLDDGGALGARHIAQ